MGSCFIFGIAGGSGSGKTTFARALQSALGPELCATLSQDHYYIDQSARFTGDGESVNFDHPNSLDFPLMAKHLAELRQGRAVEVPVYDFASHKRLERSTPFPPKPVILVDGILILSQESIRACLDFSCFVSCSEKLRFERRLRRDTRERGRKPEGVRKQFDNQVKPMHDLFVEPSKAYAGLVISGEAPFTEHVRFQAESLRRRCQTFAG